MYSPTTSPYFRFISLVHPLGLALPNARVNIIMCMPFLCSSYIREKYVLQHPYDSTL